jgi:hypothetical protein
MIGSLFKIKTCFLILSYGELILREGENDLAVDGGQEKWNW